MKWMLSFQSEWLKRKGSSASWLTLAGGLFVPVLVLVARLVQYNQTLLDGSSEGAWIIVFNRCWTYMGTFLLPIGIVLAASLIAQIEYRNQTWKQVFASPLSLNHVFWSKFLVVLVMLLMFFLYFNLGISLAVLLPSVVYPDVPFPKDGIPFWEMCQRNGLFLALSLPVLGIQYGLSLHIRNFMVPIGFGFALFLASLIGMGTHLGYLLPYCYTAMEVVKHDNQTDPTMNTVFWALGYFGLATFLNYVAFQYRFGGYRFFSRAFLRLVASSFLVLAVLAGLVFGAWKMKNRDAVLAKAIPESREARIQLVENQVGVNRFVPEKRPNPGMEARMAVFGIKGMSIAVIHHYKIDWVKHYGMADAERKIPVTDETLFEPGSISKSVHALGVMKLVETGKLNLFQDVNTYLKSWQFPYSEKAKGKKITLAQLLSHSAGLNNSGFGFTAFKEGDPLPTIPQILEGKFPATNEPLKSLFEPGKKFQYSGGGTMLSQLVLMEQTQSDYANWMKSHVLDALGMKSSFFTQPPPLDKRKFLATGYTQMKKGGVVAGRYPVMPQQAAAGLWTNATDLAKMVIQVQTGLLGMKGSFLRKESSALMLTPFHDEKAALGFFMETHLGVPYFHHEAGNPGFAGMFCGSMEDGNGLVVLINSDQGEAIFEEVKEAVGQAYQWKGFEKKMDPVVVKTIDVPDVEMARFAGIYRLKNKVLEIKKKDSDWVTASGRKQWKMYFTDRKTFFNLEAGSVKSFESNASGQITGIRFTDEKGKTQLAEKASEIQPPLSLMSLYAGSYLETDGSLNEIRIQNNELWLFSENAPFPMKIHFLSPTDFYLMEEEGLFSFDRASDGPCTGISMLESGRRVSINSKIRGPSLKLSVHP